MKRVAVLFLLLGCGKPEPAPSPTPASAPPPAAPAPVPDDLDTRTPVPLLPMMANHQKQNMRDHLAAVQEVIAAAAVHDFAAAEKAATRLGSSPQMKMMCTHMGAGAPGFTEKALAFHAEADTIIAAANKKDEPAMLAALGKTLTHCTSRHAQFKQKLVDEAGFKAATGAPPPSPHP